MLAALPAHADNNDKDPFKGVELFAVATASAGGDDVYMGDSVVVSITLYTNAEFSQVKNKADKTPSVKNATVHPYNRRRQLRQGLGVYKEKRYNAVVVEQFTVIPDETGTITFPAQKYDASLIVRTNTRGYDFFEDFFSFGSPFSRSETIKRTCVTEPLKIHVTTRPPKTIHDLQKSGAPLL